MVPWFAEFDSVTGAYNTGTYISTNRADFGPEMALDYCI
jgi:hypothetical protein